MKNLKQLNEFALAYEDVYTDLDIFQIGQKYLDEKIYLNTQYLANEGTGANIVNFIDDGLLNLDANVLAQNNRLINYFDKLFSRFKKLGLGAISGAAAAQLISFVLNKMVEKIIKEAEDNKKAKKFAGELKLRQQFNKRLKNGEDVSPEEMAKAQKTLVEALDKKSPKGKVFWAKIVKKVANIIGSKWGTLAFTLAATYFTGGIIGREWPKPGTISDQDIEDAKATTKEKYKEDYEKLEKIRKQPGHRLPSTIFDTDPRVFQPSVT